MSSRTCRTQARNSRIEPFWVSHTKSASFADLIDPSPNLLREANGGNSHSINGNVFVLGLAIAALIDDIAWLSLEGCSGTKQN